MNHNWKTKKRQNSEYFLDLVNNIEKEEETRLYLKSCLKCLRQWYSNMGHKLWVNREDFVWTIGLKQDLKKRRYESVQQMCVCVCVS